MGCKEDVLSVLESNRGDYVSGEELAEFTGVSRNAVWKAIRALKQEGFEIKSVTNKGYMLPRNSDKVTRQGIEKFLEDDFYDIIVQDVVTSTNTVAKELAAKGAREGVVVVANEQTQGKGRVGRKFFAPADCGAYMSIILRPQNILNEAAFLTVVAGVAVAGAIEEVGGKFARIKWVNDVFVDGKKCCGILSEAVTDMECGGIDHVVVGIGINVREPEGGFAEEIKDIAGVACDDYIDDARNRIIAAVLNRFEDYYLDFDKQRIAKEYKRRSFLIGRDVIVVRGDTENAARVTDIDEDCRLIVEYEDGHEECLGSGEVKIKW